MNIKQTSRTLAILAIAVLASMSSGCGGKDSEDMDWLPWILLLEQGGRVETPPTEMSSFLGINVHLPLSEEGDINWQALEDSFADLSALGFRMLRIDWEWRRIQPTAPEEGVSSYDWSMSDQLMSLAAAYDLDIYPVALYAPDWASVGDPQPGHFAAAPDPAFFSHYADFVSASIARYGPEGNAPISFRPVRSWEIWNEPNTPTFWSSNPESHNSRQYRAFLDVVAPILRDRHPEIRIIHGGLATTDYLWLWQQYDPDWNVYPEISPLYGTYFDVLSTHPYFIAIDSSPEQEAGLRNPGDLDEAIDDETGRLMSSLGFIGSHSNPGFLPKVYNQRRLMHLMHPQDVKPIWISEVGFFVGDSHPAAVSPEEQAQLLRATINYVRQHFADSAYRDQPLAVRVEKLFWFNYQDYGDDSSLASWGIVDQEGNRRPSWYVMQELLSGQNEAQASLRKGP